MACRSEECSVADLSGGLATTLPLLFCVDAKGNEMHGNKASETASPKGSVGVNKLDNSSKDPSKKRSMILFAQNSTFARDLTSCLPFRREDEQLFPMRMERNIVGRCECV